jgi:hypothetical protein
MTASRARSSDIGSERENSRIGTRRAGALAVADPLADFFRAIRSFNTLEFAMQQETRGFDPRHLTC